MPMQPAPLVATRQPNNRRAALLGTASASVLTLSLAVATAPAAAQTYSVPSSTAGNINIPAGYTGAINNGYSVGTLTNSGAITGGSTGIYNNGGSIGTLSNSGTISSLTNGVRNDKGTGGGYIGVLSNTGTISASVGNGIADLNGSTIGILTNTIGTISGKSYGVLIDNTSAIGTLANSGTIIGGTVGSRQGVRDYGTLGLLDNAGSIYGHSGVLQFGGSLGSLSNSGTISGIYAGLYLGGSTGLDSTIGAVSNNGVIQGNQTFGVFVQYSSTGTLTNTGTITGVKTGIGIGPLATIGTLSNIGTITGGAVGVNNYSTSGSIGTLSNAGTISGGNTGLRNSGTIGTLSNSGTITGSLYAINSTGTVGVVTNSGLIYGNVYVGGQDLSIVGGSGSTYGTLAGGTITVANGNLSMLSGNILLASDIAVNGGAGLVNNTANLMLGTHQQITGNFTQGAAGALIITASSYTNGGRLTVSGSAKMTNSTVVFDALNGFKPTPEGGIYKLVVANSNGTAYTNYVPVINIPGATVMPFMGVIKDGNNTDLVLEFADNPPAPPPPLPPTIYADVLTSDRLAFLNGLAAVADQLDLRRGVPTNGQNQGSMLWNDTFVWIAGTGQFVHTSNGNGIDGYSGSAGGVVVGADHAITPEIRLGGAISGNWGSLNGGNNSSYSGQSMQVQAYGTAQKGIAFIDAQIAGQFSEGTVHRNFWDGTAQGNNVNGTGVGGSLRGGLRFDVAGWGVEPSVTVGWISLSQGGVTETGPSSSNLQIGSGNFNTSYVLSGVETDHRFKLNESLDLLVSARAGWLYEMGQTTAQLLATPSYTNAFMFASAPVGRSAANLGLTTELDTHSLVHAFGRYGALVFDGSTSQLVEAGIVLRF